jgi:hypothetical protein
MSQPKKYFRSQSKVWSRVFTGEQPAPVGVGNPAEARRLRNRRKRGAA